MNDELEYRKKRRETNESGNVSESVRNIGHTD